MIRDSDLPWRAKASRIIGDLARESYERTNTRPNGGRYVKHRPYTLPALAEQLLDCLNRNDEVTAKALFHAYAIIPELGR